MFQLHKLAGWTRGSGFDLNMNINTSLSLILELNFELAFGTEIERLARLLGCLFERRRGGNKTTTGRRLELFSGSHLVGIFWIRVKVRKCWDGNVVYLIHVYTLAAVGEDGKRNKKEERDRAMFIYFVLSIACAYLREGGHLSAYVSYSAAAAAAAASDHHHQQIMMSYRMILFAVRNLINQRIITCMCRDVSLVIC